MHTPGQSMTPSGLQGKTALPQPCEARHRSGDRDMFLVFFAEPSSQLPSETVCMLRSLGYTCNERFLK